MRISVKPLVHWAIYKHYTLRYTHRSTQQVDGVLTTTTGEIDFRYDPQQMIIHLPTQTIHINEHGWEIDDCSENE